MIMFLDVQGGKFRYRSHPFCFLAEKWRFLLQKFRVNGWNILRVMLVIDIMNDNQLWDLCSQRALSIGGDE